MPARRNATAHERRLALYSLPSLAIAHYIRRPVLYLMMKQILILLFAFILVGCSRSPEGVYQSVGSEDKFRMTLDVGNGGLAKFTTRSNVGYPEVDRAVESSMSLSTGKWVKEGANLVVTGQAVDGKAVTYRFLSQKNGDLVWDKNGARLVKAK